MDRCRLFVLVILLGIGSSGCGKTENVETPAADSAQASAGASDASPDRAVFDFLEAVRVGNQDKAAQMLTALANDRTRERQMVVAPPGSKTASFEVGDVEYVTDDKAGAHVATKWTDLDADGQPRTDEIIWILRKEEVGWRIAGMATKIFEDEPPLILNFEDPEDMERKQLLAEEEMNRRAADAEPLEAKQASKTTSRN